VSGVKQLRWLRDKLVGDQVVPATGSEAHRRQDWIAVVPLALLGP
jgi:hypothetical protein